MVRSQQSPYSINSGKNDTGTGFSPNTSGFPCQCNSIHVPSFIYHHLHRVLAADSVITYHTYFLLIFGSDLHSGLRNVRLEQEKTVLGHTMTYKTLKTCIKCILRLHYMPKYPRNQRKN
jgi:hypothetical protein